MTLISVLVQNCLGVVIMLVVTLLIIVGLKCCNCLRSNRRSAMWKKRCQRRDRDEDSTTHVTDSQESVCPVAMISSPRHMFFRPPRPQILLQPPPYISSPPDYSSRRPSISSTGAQEDHTPDIETADPRQDCSCTLRRLSAPDLPSVHQSSIRVAAPHPFMASSRPTHSRTVIPRGYNPPLRVPPPCYQESPQADAGISRSVSSEDISSQSNFQVERMVGRACSPPPSYSTLYINCVGEGNHTEGNHTDRSAGEGFSDGADTVERIGDGSEESQREEPHDQCYTQSDDIGTEGHQNETNTTEEPNQTQNEDSVAEGHQNEINTSEGPNQTQNEDSVTEGHQSEVVNEQANTIERPNQTQNEDNVTEGHQSEEVNEQGNTAEELSQTQNKDNVTEGHQSEVVNEQANTTEEPQMEDPTEMEEDNSSSGNDEEKDEVVIVIPESEQSQCNIISGDANNSLGDSCIVTFIA